MTLIWHFYWPVFALAAVLGLAAGIVDFRKPREERRYALLGSAGVVAILIGLAWHGPGGAADRTAMTIERAARVTLHNYEMDQVTARLERGPLQRTLVLSGPADDFQQRQLLRIMDQIPGVQSVHWDRPLEPKRGF